MTSVVTQAPERKTSQAADFDALVIGCRSRIGDFESTERIGPVNDLARERQRGWIIRGKITA